MRMQHSARTCAYCAERLRDKPTTQDRARVPYHNENRKRFARRMARTAPQERGLTKAIRAMAEPEIRELVKRREVRG